MDKIKLIEKIKSLSLDAPMTDELIALVDTATDISPDLIKTIQSKLDDFAEAELESLALMQVEDATEELENKIEGLEKDAVKFSINISKKADEIDTAEARAKIGAG